MTTRERGTARKVKRGSKGPSLRQLKDQWRKWYKLVAWFDPDIRETEISFGAYVAGFRSAIRSTRKDGGEK